MTKKKSCYDCLHSEKGSYSTAVTTKCSACISPVDGQITFSQWETSCPISLFKVLHPIFRAMDEGDFESFQGDNSDPKLNSINYGGPEKMGSATVMNWDPDKGVIYLEHMPNDGDDDDSVWHWTIEVPQPDKLA